jgi:hypothetical protein
MFKFENVIATVISIEVRARISDDRYMGKRHEKKIVSVLSVLTGILVLVILLGQGCGSPKANGNGSIGDLGGFAGELITPLGVPTFRDVGNGNGGGYGGMVSGSQGQYGGWQSELGAAPMILSRPGPWILFGPRRTDGSCSGTRHPFAPFVHGRIDVNGLGRLVHRDSFCGRGSLIDDNEMSTIDFDPRVLIFDDDIYVRAGRIADLVIPVGYCSNARLDGEFQVGTSLFIYQKGRELFGSIAQGKHLGNQYVEFTVVPVVVNQSVTVRVKEFSSASLKLKINRNGTKKARGHLNVLLDGENLDLSMDCYLHRP